MSDPTPDNTKKPVPTPAKGKPTPVKARRRGEDEDKIDTSKKKTSWMHKVGLTIVLLMGVTMALGNFNARTFMAGFSRQGTSVGKIGTRTIYDDDQEAARQSWQTLQVIRFMSQTGPRSVADLLGDDVRQLVQEHPNDGYWLLLEYARQTVPGIEDKSLAAALGGDFTLWHFPKLELSTAPLAPNSDRVVSAMRDFLMLLSAMRAEESTIKVSTPLVEDANARMHRLVPVRAMAFSASGFPSTQPTTDQLKEQIHKYADVDPFQSPSAASPLGFGYRQQNRVKLQGVVVRYDDARRQVESRVAGEKPYAWDLAAKRYFNRNPSRFKGDVSSTTMPSFERVRDRALEYAKDAEAIRRLDGPMDSTDVERPVMEMLEQQLRDDFKAWQSAGSKSDADFLRPEYLQHVADQITRKTGIKVEVFPFRDGYENVHTLINDDRLSGFLWLDRAEAKVFHLAQYVIKYTRPFVDPSQQVRLGDNVLEIGEPSDALGKVSMFGGLDPSDRMIVRVVAAEAARPATDDDLNDPILRDQVARDWNLERRLESARAEAEKKLELAKQYGSLTMIATDSTQVSESNIHFVDWIENGNGQPSIAASSRELSGPDVAKQLMGQGTERFSVISQIIRNDKGEVTEGRVLLVQREGVADVFGSILRAAQPALMGRTMRTWSELALSAEMSTARQMISNDLLQGRLTLLYPEVRDSKPLDEALINYDELVARVGYEQEKKK